MTGKEKILVTGSQGMVGHALKKVLTRCSMTNVFYSKREDCDLRDSVATSKLMEEVKPDYVFHLAAKVYGLGGNATYMADILYDNVLINTNVVEFSRRVGVKKIVAMGSGCVYPVVNNGEYLKEEQIWEGEPHPSERAYAHAKRLLLAQLQANKEQYNMDYAFAVSGNLYGEHDKFDEENGHVIPSLIAKFYRAQRSNSLVTLWGTGIAMRDFMYGQDAAEALMFLMHEGVGPINIGSGHVHTILDIVDVLQRLTRIQVAYDPIKPDGQLKRFYDLSKLQKLGFIPVLDLEEGIRTVYLWYSMVQESSSESR